jgi:hypothetical protein
MNGMTEWRRSAPRPREVDPRVFEEIKKNGRFYPVPDEVVDEHNKACSRDPKDDFVLLWVLAESHPSLIGPETFRAQAGQALKAWDAKFFTRVAKILKHLERHKDDSGPKGYKHFLQLAFRQEYNRCQAELAFVTKDSVTEAAIELWLDFYVSNTLTKSLTPKERNTRRNEEEKRLRERSWTRDFKKIGLSNLREKGR